MAVDDMPEWRKIETVEDFVLAVRDALKVWLLMHTDAECWAQEWAQDDAARWFNELGGELSNDYFHFDWKGAVYNEMAKQWLPTTGKCPRCGMLVLEGWDIDCDCWEDGEEPYSEECAEDDLQQIIEFMEDCCIVPDTDLAERALIEQGFPVYRDALEGTIMCHVDEMQEAVRVLDQAIDDDNRWGMLTAAREATRIYHVNGEVMADYGERVGLDFRLVDDVRDNGYAEVFGRDEVSEFLQN